MNTIKVSFELGQKVIVKELERPGVVTSILAVPGSVTYQVRYFWDGEAKEVYLYDWEIE